MIPFEKLMKKYYPIHALHLRDETENLLWHQRLGHTCYQYLYNSHKYIDVVQKFIDTTYTLLDQFPTCIQSKIYKTTPDHGTASVATQSYQGLLIDFSLYGMTSDESDRNTIYEVINGKKSGY